MIDLWDNLLIFVGFQVVKRLSASFGETEVGDMLDKLCAILANLTHPKVSFEIVY